MCGRDYKTPTFTSVSSLVETTGSQPPFGSFQGGREGPEIVGQPKESTTGRLLKGPPRPSGRWDRPNRVPGVNHCPRPLIQ